MAMQTEKSIDNVVILGGGSAGWITAGLLASRYRGAASPVRVTLVESPDVKTIGVGEGTWPTMRTTLRNIGISESEFLLRCSASFKQGTRFNCWVTGADDEYYYHPFSAPQGYPAFNLGPYWQQQKDRVSFADAVSVQGYLCDRDLAPKQPATPEYAGVANYAYHLDAGKFAELLQEHCTGRLGVVHRLEHIVGVNDTADGDIRSVSTALGGDIEGDLFVDCTGFAALLLGEHYKIPFADRRDVLFNDRALAMQVPYADARGPIASQTNSTARGAGWIWDIGLTSRRGVGYTYSSAHSTDERAEAALRQYVERTSGLSADELPCRKLTFQPGHRAKFWHRNCVAVGMAAGFLEPLEASALVLVELAAKMISEELPANRAVMDIVARRYNDRFLYRWDRIIDFLKLHYVLSRRDDSDYWRDNRAAESIPDSLAELLALWRFQPPGRGDLPQVDEVFSAASYQYVLYGMGFETAAPRQSPSPADRDKASRLFAENIKKANQVVAGLPTNRALLNELASQSQTHPDAGQAPRRETHG
jgi:flavin-dependent dehydrogenase